MEEIGRLSRSLHFPPVEIANDKSSFSKLKILNWKNEFKLVCEKLINELQNTESDSTLKRHCNEVVSLMILCGENYTIAEWNDSHIVDETNKALLLLTMMLGFQTLAEIFKQETISLSLIQELKSKLNKENIKKYPASVHCFIWATKLLSVTQLETLASQLLPVCLVLLDDWEPEYQIKGLDCIYHVLKENPASLEKFGWYRVIYENLRKSTRLEDQFRIYECLDMCLKNQVQSRVDKRVWNTSDEYDRLVDEVLQKMLMDASSKTFSLCLEILLMLINSMQVKIASHLHPLFSNLEDKVTDTISEDEISLICKIIDKVLVNCWPCFEERLCSHLTWLLYKVSVRAGANCKAFNHTKKSFASILNNVCPSLSSVIHG